MDTYEVLMVLFTFGLFLVAFISLVVKIVSEILRKTKK